MTARENKMTEFESLVFNLKMGFKVYVEVGSNYYEDFDNVKLTFLAGGGFMVECANEYHCFYGGSNDTYDFYFDADQFENVVELLGDMGFDFKEDNYGCEFVYDREVL